MLALLVLAGILAYFHSAHWTSRHRAAAAGGLLMTYGWFGLVQPPAVEVGAIVQVVGDAVGVGSAVALSVWIWRRSRRIRDLARAGRPESPARP